jgi:hypothetical protein
MTKSEFQAREFMIPLIRLLLHPEAQEIIRVIIQRFGHPDRDGLISLRIEGPGFNDHSIGGGPQRVAAFADELDVHKAVGTTGTLVLDREKDIAAAVVGYQLTVGLGAGGFWIGAEGGFHAVRPAVAVGGHCSRRRQGRQSSVRWSIAQTCRIKSHAITVAELFHHSTLHLSRFIKG